MALVEKVIWYVESHLDDDLSLAGIAGLHGVTPSHLARAFVAATGTSLLRYVRRRRLSRALARLAAREGNVVQVALDAGYGSHEAFTRAFRSEFGMPPSSAQALGNSAHLPALDPKDFDMTTQVQLPDPVTKSCPARHFVGLQARYSAATRPGIPGQWARFNTEDPEFEGQLPGAGYGVVHGFTDDGEWNYLCGNEVKRPIPVPNGYTAVTVPAAVYAVFSAKEHIAAIDQVMTGILDWIAAWDRELAEGATLERYGPEFDPKTGGGGFEVWVPIAAHG
ncbi:Transposon Tn10 TetD protein [Defluviimonas aquaemixtae]|uniref:Transposon Tn10 TetD protein n=1 Tax=Albidovulum aquaemixtae TaxID=1542388 RepID=A0A2R8BN70_9RHOB|nr:AraC family transcriptional regulator [Defluviimonas aquaemixtae]SPH24812.1 Transposon Tn10 TetD protein [Defluviimonas aquaemixtae]